MTGWDWSQNCSVSFEKLMSRVTYFWPYFVALYHQHLCMVRYMEILIFSLKAVNIGKNFCSLFDFNISLKIGFFLYKLKVFQTSCDMSSRWHLFLRKPILPYNIQINGFCQIILRYFYYSFSYLSTKILEIFLRQFCEPIL